MLHHDAVHAEAGHQQPLVRRECADADLHQRDARTVFKDAGERARVRVAIALELVVEIAVRVDVQQGQRRSHGGDGPQDGIGDRVIATQGDGLEAGGQDRADAHLDLRARLLRRL